MWQCHCGYAKKKNSSSDRNTVLYYQLLKKCEKPVSKDLHAAWFYLCNILQWQNDSDEDRLGTARGWGWGRWGGTEVWQEDGPCPMSGSGSGYRWPQGSEHSLHHSRPCSSPEGSICSAAWGESPEVLPLRAIDKVAGSSLGYSCSFLWIDIVKVKCFKRHQKL